MDKIIIEDKVDWKREDSGAAFVSYPMSEIFDEEDEEKKTLNAKCHRAKRRDEIRTARAVKRGEYQKMMRDVKDGEV